MRQIILDTETTGLEPSQGHRIIEIGCVELINRRLTNKHFHRYINPQREIEQGALNVHGISNKFLADKPLFKDILDELLVFIKGAQLIIHNAPFDVGFINHELKIISEQHGQITDFCTVLDTLALARQLHPGQRNSLDALCKRYQIDNSQRQLHGALLDAEILALVYLAMTGGQGSLFDESGSNGSATGQQIISQQLLTERPPLRVVRATAEEELAHQQRLAAIEKMAGRAPLWKKWDQN